MVEDDAEEVEEADEDEDVEDEENEPDECAKKDDDEEGPTRGAESGRGAGGMATERGAEKRAAVVAEDVTPKCAPL